MLRLGGFWQNLLSVAPAIGLLTLVLLNLVHMNPPYLEWVMYLVLRVIIISTHVDNLNHTIMLGLLRVQRVELWGQ